MNRQRSSMSGPAAETLQRIHPVDVEAPPPSQTAPLVPRDQTNSEKGDPVPIDGRRASRPPRGPSFRRTIPVSYSRPPRKRRSCCYICFCWTVLSIILLAVAIAATVGILYLVFDPQIPKYSVNSLTVSSFSVDQNLEVHAAFNLSLTAENPNKKIGIYYESGSSLDVLYSSATLCSGEFPAFYQGHQNVTVLDIPLAGSDRLGSDLLGSLKQQEQNGAVPLQFKGDVPVRVKLGSLKLWKVTFRVNCDLQVNTLSVGTDVVVKSSSCKIRLKL